MVGTETTSSGKLFHWLMSLCVKKLTLSCNLHCCLLSFKWWLLVWVVSRARPYSRRVRVWGIWAETHGKKECFNCLRNRVIRSSMWSVPTVGKRHDVIVQQMLQSDWST